MIFSIDLYQIKKILMVLLILIYVDIMKISINKDNYNTLMLLFIPLVVYLLNNYLKMIKI